MRCQAPPAIRRSLATRGPNGVDSPCSRTLHQDQYIAAIVQGTIHVYSSVGWQVLSWLLLVSEAGAIGAISTQAPVTPPALSARACMLDCSWCFQPQMAMGQRHCWGVWKGKCEVLKDWQQFISLVRNLMRWRTIMPAIAR